jgi:tRNA(adenine34) deaminase
MPDRYYLEWAVMLSEQAYNNGYSPVGAIAVNERTNATYYASSKREIGNIYHAEYLALTWAQKEPLELAGFTLYSTLEPCIMCAGMATVMKASRIVWLVDDIWAGASRVYNPNNPYIQKRSPEMAKVDISDLHKKAQDMWVDYLRNTGHPDAVSFMLGLPEDYQCK